MSLADLLDGVAVRRPDDPCLTWDGGAASYRDVSATVEAQAAALRAAGGRIGVMLPNRPELVTLWLGCMRAGVTPVFLSPQATDTEVEQVVDDLGLAGVVRQDDEPAAVRVVYVEPGPGAPAVKGAAAVVLTSGSTGHPKYVPVPHAAYDLKGTLNALALDWRPTDRAYGVMPLFHVGGQCETLAPAIASGASVHLAATFSASTLWADVERLGITHLHGTGSLLAMALARGRPESALPLRRIVASLRDDLAAALAESLPGVELITLYGLTECPLATLSALGEPYRSGWVGYPYEGWAGLRLADADGRPVAAGEEGEIQLRNAACTRGYLGPAPEDPFTADGWLRTGDVGLREGDGLRLTGRIKEMIRRSGENIAPAQVEEAALRHPLVVEVAAVGHADPIRDEEVRLFVEVPAGGPRLDPAELRAFLAVDLAPFKLPRYVDVLETLPRTPSNKVDKVALVARHPTPSWDAETGR